MTQTYTTAAEVRLAARSHALRGPTTGMCPGYVQANLLVVPSAYADDFRTLCARNPNPCPLLAESIAPGEVGFAAGVADGIDITTDVPGYSVYEDGVLVKEDVADIRAFWTPQSVAFLIGCSFTFEAALLAAGLGVRHIELGRNVPMYRTTLELIPSGAFGGTTVVSMRPFPAHEVERVRATTRRYARTHGEPIAWGWDAVATLGIEDVHAVDYGDPPVFRDGEVPVFWGCGVTPQLAVMSSRIPGTVLGHAPGKMVCLDLKVEDILDKKGRRDC